MIIRYLDLLERLEFELIQRRDEGLEIIEETRRFEELKAAPQSTSPELIQEQAGKILSALADRPVPADLELAEPNDLAGIRKLRPAPVAGTSGTDDLSPQRLHDAILGGWLGRAGGCLLGKPIERYHRTIIREMLESNHNWPLDNYFTQAGMPRNILDKYPWKRRWGLESLRENIQCMPEDDDLNFTMLNLHVMESYGPSFSSQDIGQTWLQKLPVFEVFTAERVAYHNLLNGISPPRSASHLNPFREWIGAQIRADLWGYVCPGDPQRAAEFAWRDARLTHLRSGIYGEMFFAALMAGAFVEADLRKLVQIGLAQVPAGSRFARAIQFVLELPLENEPWETVLDRLYAEFGHYHWVHTINNAALCVAALLHAGGDYEKTITQAVMGGWDTDCNGATTGSIIGVRNGSQALPGKWIDPLQDRVRSSLGGFDHSRFSDLAQRSLSMARKVSAAGENLSPSATDDF